MSQRIITLVYEKNHYLEKFYSLNEKELNNFVQGDFQNLETFYETREKILEMIRYVDLQIEKTQNEVVRTGTELADKTKRELKTAMKIKDEYVERIIKQDIDILACIDHAKTEIIKELQNLKKSKKAVSGYRMPDFQNRLDEKA